MWAYWNVMGTILKAGTERAQVTVALKRTFLCPPSLFIFFALCHLAEHRKCKLVSFCPAEVTLLLLASFPETLSQTGKKAKDSGGT